MSAHTDAAATNGTRHWYQSISAKLQIAFGLIAALTIGATVVAILRFGDVNTVISRLTDVSLPTVKLSLALENKAAAIASAADDLASAIDEGERKAASSAVASRFGEFKDVVAQLEGMVGSTDAVRRLTEVVTGMDREITELDRTVEDRIARTASRQASVEAVNQATDQLISSLGPAGDTILATIRKAIDAGDGGTDTLRTVVRQNMPTLQALYDTRTDIVGVANVLNLASAATSAEAIPPLSNQFSSLYRRIARNLEVVIADPNADPTRVDELIATVRR